MRARRPRSQCDSALPTAALLIALAMGLCACGDDGLAGGAAGTSGAGGGGGAAGGGGNGGGPDAATGDAASGDGPADAVADAEGASDAGGPDAFQGLPSWNLQVPCQALLTRIEHIVGNQTNSNGGATYAGGNLRPGIPNKNSLTPPCSRNGVPTFVEVHGVTIVRAGVARPAGDGDYTFGLTDASSARPVNLRSLHAEIPASWISAGVAPSRNYSVGERIDIQGFVFWDAYHLNNSFHFYSGWEIHPVTAWRRAQ